MVAPGDTCQSCGKAKSLTGSLCGVCALEVVEARRPRFDRVDVQPVILTAAEWEARLTITHPHDHSYKGDGT